MLTGLYNQCARGSIVPASSKRARVVLLKKGGKPKGGFFLWADLPPKRCGKVKYANPQIFLNGQTLEMKQQMKYLGIVFDRKLLFKTHICDASAKAERTTNQLGRLMFNIGGPKQLRRRLYVSITQSVIGDHVVGMRQTKAGSLRIELKGDQQQIEAVRVEVSRTTGANVEVKSLQQMVEIRDLDQWTDGEEVASAMVAETGVNRDSLKVVSVRERFGSTQTALVTMPSAACQKMLAHGRILFDLVNCRIRQGDQKVRCFWCLSFGHMSKNCDGADRSKFCKHCGSQGHFAKDCTAVVSDAVAVIKILEKESSVKLVTKDSRGEEPSSYQYGLPPN
ncbi:hypothetical protein QTP88_010551 [Uroleucon formosanum]